MARASIRTWLPLDRWAQLIGGINPLHFNQLFLSNLPNCGSVWYQWEWQASDQVSREEIAQAIHSAEEMISTEVGYNLLPDWSKDVDLVPTKYMDPSMGISPPLSIGYRLKTIEIPTAYYIQGGVRAVASISLGAAVTTHDLDGDGWSETCRVSVTSSIDPNEIRLFFSGHSGSPEWEIRPISISGTSPNYVLEFKRWLMVKQTLLERMNTTPLDASDSASFETTVDVYRVYTDPSDQAELIYSRDIGGSWDMETGVLEGVDPRLGIVSYTPGTWDPTTETYLSTSIACRDPDRVKFNYLSGYRLNSSLHTMDPFWEKAVAYFSIAFLSRSVCDCSNISDFVDHWKEDLAMIVPSSVSYQLPYEMVKNPFGTARGALFAWQACHQNGRKITR